MTEETIGEALDQIVIDAGAEDTKTRTSPKTIQIQDSKTASSKAEWLHISISEEGGEGQGTYDVGRREMKRERLHAMKPKLKAWYEKSLKPSAPAKGKFNARGVFKPASKNAVSRRKNLTM
jgi:hypothetical protein